MKFSQSLTPVYILLVTATFVLARTSKQPPDPLWIHNIQLPPETHPVFYESHVTVPPQPLIRYADVMQPLEVRWSAFAVVHALALDRPQALRNLFVLPTSLADAVSVTVQLPKAGKVNSVPPTGAAAQPLAVAVTFAEVENDHTLSTWAHYKPWWPRALAKVLRDERGLDPDRAVHPSVMFAHILGQDVKAITINELKMVAPFEGQTATGEMRTYTTITTKKVDYHQLICFINGNHKGVQVITIIPEFSTLDTLFGASECPVQANMAYAVDFVDYRENRIELITPLGQRLACDFRFLFPNIRDLTAPGFEHIDEIDCFGTPHFE